MISLSNIVDVIFQAAQACAGTVFFVTATIYMVMKLKKGKK